MVDPGIGVERPLDDVLREHRLQPVAVLLTHGHIDHMFSVTPVCGARGVPAYIHSDDRYRLADPLVDARAVRCARDVRRRGSTWTEPDDVRRLADGVRLELAGLSSRSTTRPGTPRGR